MREHVMAVIAAVSAWEAVTIEVHRFGGQEFKLENVEIGHVHQNGLVDIPFTRVIREQIVAEALAEPHHILPESGWISFYMRQGDDVARAIWLLRLSYVQKRMSRNRRDPDQLAMLLAILNELQPGPTLRDLIA
jgi:hypothetical protein